MKTTNLSWLKYSVLTLSAFAFGILMNSCGEGEKKEVVKEIDETTSVVFSPTRDAKIQFYHAWLADCVNDTILTVGSAHAASDTLSKLARTRIFAATRDSQIINGFGEGRLVEELVWGPVVVAEPSEFATGTYTSANLMYCLRIKTGGRVTGYSIGIAGTNSLSQYDWFNEDFGTENVVSWSNGGNISVGAKQGFKNLNSMTSAGQTLTEWLIIDYAKNPSATIAVTGHSLGGTMAQVYSSYLSQQLPVPTAATSRKPVDAYVYAGPTAGDAGFATHLLSTLGNYNAFNNSLDLIPHAWEKTTLNNLCSIYDGLMIGDSIIKDGLGINAFVTYLVVHSENGKYKMPGNPRTFLGTPAIFTPTEVSDLNSAIYAAWEFEQGPYDGLNGIAEYSQGRALKKGEFYSFMYYFTEMGLQHTTAYVDVFIPNLESAMNRYCPGGMHTYTEDDDANLILTIVANNAYNKLKAKRIKNYACNSN